jgi:hypothetical protein
MLKLYLIISALILFSSIVSGQKLLFHKNRYRQALYKIGDEVSFRMNNDRTKVTERIIGFEDSLIVFQSFKVNPSKITHLYVDSKTKGWYILRYKYKRIFIIAGFGYLLLDAANTEN